MPTFGQLVTGTGGTAAESITQIGNNITLPAGGPWLIHHIWGMVAMDTAVTSEAAAGALLLSAVSGDLTPDPAPGLYPLVGHSSQMSANYGLVSVPLNMYEVGWQAAGKASVSLSYVNDAGNATAPIVACGIIFGDARPEKRPLMFSDRVAANLTAASEATIGTITISEKATRIVGVAAVATKDGAVTADEGMIATVRLDSADFKMPPMQLPCTNGFSACDGTPAGGTSIAMPQFIPVDIPIIGGSRVNAFGTLINAVTAGLDVQVFIAYE
jgi:hypothetical protein